MERERVAAASARSGKRSGARREVREAPDPEKLVYSGARLKKVRHAISGDDVQHSLSGHGFSGPGEHIANQYFVSLLE